MANIGLFGGTFDPIHTGHIKLCERVVSTFSLDRLILIPTGNPYHKQAENVTDRAHRFKMVQLATERIPYISVSDYEIARSAPGYSYETITHFKKQLPEDRLFFIVGGDSFRDFPKWKCYETLISLCTFIVVSRPGVEPESYFQDFTGNEKPPRVLFLKDFFADVSSTDIRQRVKQGKDINGLVPRAVLDYIQRYTLYQQE